MSGAYLCTGSHNTGGSPFGVLSRLFFFFFYQGVMGIMFFFFCKMRDIFTKRNRLELKN